MEPVQDATAPGQQPTFRPDMIRSGPSFIRFAKAWVRVMWLDILTLMCLAGTTLGIYKTPVVAVRHFPMTYPNSSIIVDPTLAYPHRGWIISPQLSGIISLSIPLSFVALAQFRVRSFWDLNNGILGVFQSTILSSLTSVITKQLIGGFRPYWLAVCQPDVSLAGASNSAATGFQQIMYTSDICTQTDRRLLGQAMSSFPSGHAATGAAGFVFLFLYANARLKVWSDHRPAVWKLALTMLSLLAAFLKACVLAVDQAHHWYDILVGAAIGSGMALASYRTCFAAVWDARFNHVPLDRASEFDYALYGGPGGGVKDGVVTRVGDWGKEAGHGDISGKEIPSGDQGAVSDGVVESDSPRSRWPARIHRRGKTDPGRGDEVV